ncbi:MAG TPA: sensor histidine kinase, partial [Gemmatimonadales bacterium]|nr:sensor histidine kinase [Gemmatimonadales bacterium]
GGIVARQVIADLNQSYLQQRLQQAAVAEERARFARDLHDGVLQSLTGLALQLKTLERLIATDPKAARARLADLQALLAAEQADLRFFVRQMKPIPLSRTEVNAGLLAHLRELAARTERQWGLRVELTAGPLTRQLSEPLAHGVYRILQEALTNAARHGGATVARVELAERDDRLHLTVADDGRGFPFRGRYDLAALGLMHQGPASLKERVASLGGDLTIDSSESGARLEVSLPLRPALHVVAAADAWTTPPPPAGQDVPQTG